LFFVTALIQKVHGKRTFFKAAGGRGSDSGAIGWYTEWRSAR